MKAFRFARMMSGYANRHSNYNPIIVPVATALLLSYVAAKRQYLSLPAMAQANRPTKVLSDELKKLDEAPKTLFVFYDARNSLHMQFLNSFEGRQIAGRLKAQGYETQQIELSLNENSQDLKDFCSMIGADIGRLSDK